MKKEKTQKDYENEVKKFVKSHKDFYKYANNIDKFIDTFHLVFGKNAMMIDCKVKGIDDINTIYNFVKSVQGMKNKKQILDSNNLNTVIKNVCSNCGIEANILTCRKRYGKEPNKICFDCSTFHTGKCDFCGKIKPITETRDFFFPDFSLLKKSKTKKKK